MQTVYLAGPEVFLPHAIEIGRRKKQLCAKYGFEGLFPFDNEISPTQHQRIDRLIYLANEGMMRRADFGICNLTPFRGPSADAGTVFELGFMAGLGKRVFAYTNSTADYAARVLPASALAPDAELSDADGLMLENFGTADNLMIDWAVFEHGRVPIVRHDGAGALDDLAGFEECLRLAGQD